MDAVRQCESFAVAVGRVTELFERLAATDGGIAARDMAELRQAVTAAGDVVVPAEHEETKRFLMASYRLILRRLPVQP